MQIEESAKGPLSTGNVTNPEPQDNSAAGIQWQHYQLGLAATGAALGVGRRTVPDPSTQFSKPLSLSNSQFGTTTGGAKSMLGEV